MSTGEWIGLAALLLTAAGIVAAGLRYVIRNEFSGSVDKVTASANHLASTLQRVDLTLTRAMEEIKDHDKRIAIIEDRTRRSL